MEDSRISNSFSIKKYSNFSILSGTNDSDWLITDTSFLGTDSYVKPGAQTFHDLNPFYESLKKSTMLAATNVDTNEIYKHKCYILLQETMSV